MAYWRDRHIMYKLSYCALYLSTTAYMVGFSVPMWSSLNLEEYGLKDQIIGLWQACLRGTTVCQSNVHANNPAWINATRGLCCLTLALYVLAALIGGYCNITSSRQDNSRDTSRVVEGLTIVAGVSGMVGVIVYAAEFHSIYIQEYRVGHLEWAFGVVCASLGLSTVCAGLMLIFRTSYHRRPRTITFRTNGHNGIPVSVMLSGSESGTMYIPYLGEISETQFVPGALPVLPPSYDMVTGISSYSNPPQNDLHAPPAYEDIIKGAFTSEPYALDLKTDTNKEMGNENP